MPETLVWIPSVGIFIIYRIFASFGLNQGKFRTAKSTSAIGNWIWHLLSTSFERRTAQPLVEHHCFCWMSVCILSNLRSGYTINTRTFIDHSWFSEETTPLHRPSIYFQLLWFMAWIQGWKAWALCFSPLFSGEQIPFLCSFWRFED